MPGQTVQQAILYRALRLAGMTMGPGRTASPDQLADALAALNGLTDLLNTNEGAIFTIQPLLFTLSPSKISYTIGIDPQGIQIADFAAVRPTRIEQARLVLTNSPTWVYLPLHLATDAEWASISVRQVPVTIPKVLYCDYAWPLASLFFFGYPTQANKVELWVWQNLPQFAAVTSPYTAPPGYTEMLTYMLAARLQEQFISQLQVPPNPNLEAHGRRLLGRIKSLNQPNPRVGSADWGQRGGRTGGGSWNYMSGGPA